MMVSAGADGVDRMVNRTGLTSGSIERREPVGAETCIDNELAEVGVFRS